MKLINAATQPPPADWKGAFKVDGFWAGQSDAATVQLFAKDKNKIVEWLDEREVAPTALLQQLKQRKQGLINYHSIESFVAIPLSEWEAIIAALEEKEATPTDEAAAKAYADRQFIISYEELPSADKDAWVAYYDGYLEGLGKGREQLQHEIEQLRAWKESAKQVMPDMQKIAKLIGVPLGQSVHDKIVPYLEQQAAKEWISVKDLPRSSENVLGLTNSGRRVITWVDSGTSNLDTQDINDDDYFTHWMPLPPRPTK
jgi:hypothetical protein